ncbi:uncharacterized protein LOC106883259 isoform X1 [Octopus bimaculoides]|uniref:uncharacterized protein LOC106883259 isoform X1 n=1 Tax=Octopus bimaculoides TaxID=37653 RepID=UPI00071CF790|nr:uncharacterized protein LOC106883259 isoform X1 [Octopus bimaculoides]|eukprot:XP_014789683.1 PREDICTED: uncharacterized protein LOC106883259 isoform X1 [Octopus bimaculoides]
MKLFLIFLLTSCLVVENTHGLPDLAGIIAGLSGKTIELLKKVTVPLLDTQIGFLRTHIEHLVSFFKGSEGDIPVPETSFVLHFVADRCHIIGKRFLLPDLFKCKAVVTENESKLTSTCTKGTQKEAISCAMEEVMNLIRLLSITLKNKEN